MLTIIKLIGAGSIIGILLSLWLDNRNETVDIAGKVIGTIFVIALMPAVWSVFKGDN